MMKSILWPILLVFSGASAFATITSQTAQTTVTLSAVPQAVPSGFPFQQASDLLVTDAGSGGAPRSPAATLVLGSDYTVTGGGYNSANAMQTGSLQVVGTGASSVLANDVITITRNVPINQITSLISSGALTVQNIEQGLDKQATISQMLYNDLPQSQGLTPLSITSAGLINSGFTAQTGQTFNFGNASAVVLPTSVTAQTVAISGMISVLSYGADSTGTNDSTTAIQNALNAAFAANTPLFFPAGTYICGKVTWQGVSIFGSGIGQTIIAGKASSDVFYVPDPSISETGSSNNWPTDISVSDLTVKLNNSASVTNTTRIAWPITGSWASNSSISANTYYTTSGGAIYLCLVAGTTSNTPPSNTSGISTDGTVTWYYVAPAQVTYGNAAFCFPLNNGTDTSANYIIRIKFRNVQVACSNSKATGNAVGWYFQRPCYAAQFLKCQAYPSPYGIIGSLPYQNWSAYTWSSDTTSWTDVDFSCVVPFRWFMGGNCSVKGMNIYAESAGNIGAEIWPAIVPGEVGPDHWNFTNYYCEPSSSTTGRLMLISGFGDTFASSVLKGDSGAETVDVIATACTFTDVQIGNDGTNAPVNLFGNNNKFENTHVTNIYSEALPSTLVNDQGLGNSFAIGKVDSTVLESERQILAQQGTVRPAYGLRGTEWITEGLTAAPYFDTLIGFREMLDSTGQLFPVEDSTLETGGYARRTTFTASVGGTVANRLPLTIGTRIPATKVRIYFKGRLNTSIACYITVRANGTTVAQINPTWTSSWQVFNVGDADLTSYAGYPLQILISNPAGSATYQDIAWFAIQPWANKLMATATLPGGTAPIVTTAASITSGAGSSTGTLTNAPAVGNPTSWIPINDNGTTRYIPAW